MSLAAEPPPKRQLVVVNQNPNSSKTKCFVEPTNVDVTHSKSTINDPITSNILRNLNSSPEYNNDNISESKSDSCWSISNQCRKKLFFVLMTILIFLICFNLFLTLWILKVLEFSISWITVTFLLLFATFTDGMSHLKIVQNGIRIDGQTIILGSLIANKIKSKPKHPLVFESSGNLSINIRNQNDDLMNQFFIGNNILNCTTDVFRIVNRHGKTIFSVNEDETFIKSENVQISNSAGAKFAKSIQTSLIRSKPKHDLRLESVTKSLKIDAVDTVELKSSVGNVDLQSYKDINIQSHNGRILIEGNEIRFNNFLKSFPVDSNEAYNLCLCPNGKVFTSSLTCKLSNLQLCN